MKPRERTKLSLRTTGLIVSLGVFLIACGLIGLSAVWGRRAGSGTGPASPISKERPLTMPPVPTDITAEGLRGAGRARVQFVSRDDPRRAAGHLEFASLDPTGKGEAIVMEPRGELYLRDGVVLRISAAKGTISYPAGLEQLEAGVFSGGVSVELIEPARAAVDGDATAKVAPTVRVFTPTLHFSVATGEVWTDDRFRASSEQFEIVAKGVRIVGNQTESQLRLLTIGEPERVLLAPHRKRAGAGAAGKKAEPEAAKATGNAKAAAREQFYHATIQKDFWLLRRGMVTEGAIVEAWARLVDGELAPGAIAGMGDDRSRPAGRAGDEPARRSEATARRGSVPPAPSSVLAIEGEPESLFGMLTDPEIVQIRWAGPLVISPLDTRPSELAENEVAAAIREGTRGASGATGTQPGVRIRDADIGADVAAGRIDYGMTTQLLQVFGADHAAAKGVPAAGSRRATLALANRGTLHTPMAAMNLATGVGVARGDSKLVASESTEARPKQIAWKQQADIVMTTRDGSIGDRLKEVIFQGDVLARDGDSTFAAQWARSVFAGFERPEGPVDAQLARIEARGKVVARDGGDGGSPKTAAGRTPGADPAPPSADEIAASTGGELSGDSVDIVFEPVGKSSDPRELLARGNVRAARGDWAITANELDATLDRDERREVVVKTAAARGNAEVRGRGVFARADQINADVEQRVIDLMGQSVALARENGLILGTQMRLTGDREELFVFGPGDLFLLSGSALDPQTWPATTASGGTLLPDGARVHTRWEKSLLFNNLDGKAECAGAATAAWAASELERSTLRSGTINLRFTPGASGGAGGGGAELFGETGGAAQAKKGGEPEWRLLLAEAVGESLQREGGARASIESERFAAASANAAARQRVVERRMYIEGDRLTANAEQRVIEIPGAGRALIDDCRAEDPAKPPLAVPASAPSTVAAPGGRPGAVPADLAGARGTTLLDWKHSLKYTAADGVIRLLGSAPLGAGATGTPTGAESAAPVAGSGGVTIRHRDAPGAPVLRIDSDSASATLRTSGERSEGVIASLLPGQQAELLRASCDGNVSVALPDGARVTAASTVFDARARTIEALSSPSATAGTTNAWVVYTTTNDPIAKLARRLIWDLDRGTPRVIEPAPVVVPR